ncbi:MAG: glycoside hydrolase domain-containing protein [Phycisphaerae bacterium]
MARTGRLVAAAQTRFGPVLLALGLSAPLPGAGCATGGLGGPLSVWVVSGSRELTGDSEPLLENEIYSASRQTIQLTAAINETVSFQIGLRTSNPPAGPLNIQITDLDGPGGKLAARLATSIYRVHYVRVEHFHSWYPARTGRSTTPGSFPDILVPWEAPRGGGPLRLDQTRNEVVWVDLFVPPTTEPGVYTGRLELYPPAGRKPVFSCTLRLTVIPVVIPSERRLPLLCRIDPRDLLVEQLNWPRLAAAETRILPVVPSHQAAKRLVDATMQLFHEHRTTPLLWAGFPKYRLTGTRSVAIDWEAYDQLVAGWLDGDAFPDRVGLARWAIPASELYPNAERNGGFESARYARLLAAYLAECSRHFAERGWLDRSFLRFTPPGKLSQDTIDRMRRVSGIVRQSEARLPVVAHLPARSLRPFGWYDAGAIELREVDIWAPPARWYEPEALQRERGLGKQAWFVPDLPPYSASLAVEAPAIDARLLAWQAYRYGVDALWVEHAAEFQRSAQADRSAAGDALIYPGAKYGLIDRPVPSIRLKRLRRGLLDYELLRLLEHQGRPLLATRTAEQLVRWAFTDACGENLLSTRAVGWPDNAYILGLARKVLLQELVNEFRPSRAGRDQQDRNLTDWGSVMTQSTRVHAEVRGARLATAEAEQRAYLFAHVSNGTDRALHGRWLFPALPVGWQPVGEQTTGVAPNGRATTTIELNLRGLMYNLDGVYPFQMLFDTQAAGAFSAAGRLAIAACPLVDIPPTIDGSLSDWMLASNNVAGDFRLARGEGPSNPGGIPGKPTLPSGAFFCMDREHLYFAIRCQLNRDEEPLWRADNTIPLDGAIPWGQDVVEILLDPHNTAQGTGENIYCLQIKPSGLLVARRGCLTDPPMNPSELWQSGARVAVRVEDELWIVEVALPLSSLGRAAARNRIWGCNITRLDARRGEYSSWSGARGYTYAPHLLGNLVLLRP